MRELFTDNEDDMKRFGLWGVLVNLGVLKNWSIYHNQVPIHVIGTFEVKEFITVSVTVSSEDEV